MLVKACLLEAYVVTFTSTQLQLVILCAMMILNSAFVGGLTILYGMQFRDHQNTNFGLDCNQSIHEKRRKLQRLDIRWD